MGAGFVPQDPRRAYGNDGGGGVPAADEWIIEEERTLGLHLGGRARQPRGAADANPGSRWDADRAVPGPLHVPSPISGSVVEGKRGGEGRPPGSGVPMGR